MKDQVQIIILVIGIPLLLICTNTILQQFLLGILVCLLCQTILLILYCLIKIQSTYLNSTRITLITNNSLNPENDYPFSELIHNDNFFLNRYSQQARVFNKKNSLKLTSLNSYYQDQTYVNDQSRVSILLFLKEIKQYYYVLDIFNKALVQFGKEMESMQKHGFFTTKQFMFIKSDTQYPSQINLQQLRQEDRKILNEAKVKLKIRKENFQVILPNWQIVMKAMSVVAKQYLEMQHIRLSNTSMFEMIHTKVLQDYEYIHKQIKDLSSIIDNIRNDLTSLKMQQQKYQAHQTFSQISSQPSTDMIYWLKKQYYDFTDLQLRIKQAENNFQIQSEKLKYYKQKLASFLKQNRRKYLSIIKTRFIGFLDNYNITLQENIKEFRKILQYNFQQIPQFPPKVNKIIHSINMNQMILAENIYQYEYFQRVEYFINKIKYLNNSLESLSQYLDLNSNIFHKIILNLKLTPINHQMKYFTKFFQELHVQSQQVQKEIINLKSVNKKMIQQNQSQLQKISINIKSLIQKSQKILKSLRIQDGSIKYKYRITKIQLQQNYKQLEEQIKLIQQFQGYYITHSTRIRKIILISFLGFFNQQSKTINFGQFSEKHFTETDYDIPEQKQIGQGLQNLEDVNQQQKFDLLDQLDQGTLLISEYVNLLNKFIFVSYTQWKQSQFFKQTLSKQMYILLNFQPNDSLSQITVDNIKIEGLPPQIISIKELKSEEYQFLADIKIACKGKLSFSIKTSYKFFRVNVPLQVRIEVDQLYCVARVCFVGSELGKSWFSFIGEPIAKFNIVPVIARYTLDITTVKKIFEDLLLKKLRQTTYPIRQPINVPLSKQNQDIIMIQNRFKVQTNNL